MNEKEKISVIILAAGYSNRMNQEKFTLMFDDRRTFLEKIIQEYIDFNCSEIIVVLNSKGLKIKNSINFVFPENVRFILNAYPEKERFYSLKTGLQALTTSDFIFIQNIDNPFVNQMLLSELIKNKNQGDYIVPEFEGKGGHPIMISEKIVNELISEKDDMNNLRDFLKRFRYGIVNVNDFNILDNINTSEDYNRFINLKRI
jgi:molybdenum cofactor cytidylyltransferase